MIAAQAGILGRKAIWPLAGLLGLFAFYVIALDQGYLLNLVQGATAFDQNLIHEFLHDGRHAFGFPCH